MLNVIESEAMTSGLVLVLVKGLSSPFPSARATVKKDAFSFFPDSYLIHVFSDHPPRT
jgi:hypothetical protein